jgi:hypothetical protein
MMTAATEPPYQSDNTIHLLLLLNKRMKTNRDFRTS